MKTSGAVRLRFGGPATLLVAAILAGCASASAPRGAASSGAAATRILRADEIRAAGAVTALEAVRRLRPEWLRSRSPTSLRDQIDDAPGPPVVVYLDDIRFGGVESLHSLRAHEVVSIEYVEGAVASVRFGTGHEGGAILVRTR